MSNTWFSPPEFAVEAMPQLPPETAAPSNSSSSIIIVVIIIASAVIVSASIYLLLRVLSKKFRRRSRTFSVSDDVVLRNESAVESRGMLDSLPLFSFRSVSGGGDCAVCLSKFEAHDQLRLLPLCCHAFHSSCIDTWIVSNQTCPLCRSTVLPSEADVLDKIRNSGSLRIEIGSVREVAGERRTYSIGSLDYVVDDGGSEIPVGSSTHRRGSSDCTSVDKESSVGGEESGRRNWLERLAPSFRSSGRFFSGEDLEANRVGEEISELFRWLSGI